MSGIYKERFMRTGEQRRRRRQPDEGVDTTDLLERAWRIFDMVEGKIEHADVKAGVILGACGVTAAAVLGLITGRGRNSTLLTIAAIASGISIIVAAAFACGALWPRRRKRYPADSHLYFDHITRRSADSSPAFEREIRVLLTDPKALTDEIIAQVKATSRVASQKYNFLDRAMFCIFGSLLGLATSATIFAVHYRHG
jgi:hypothetical protein